MLVRLLRLVGKFMNSCYNMDLTITLRDLAFGDVANSCEDLEYLLSSLISKYPTSQDILLRSSSFADFGPRLSVEIYDLVYAYFASTHHTPVPFFLNERRSNSQ